PGSAQSGSTLPFAAPGATMPIDLGAVAYAPPAPEPAPPPTAPARSAAPFFHDPSKLRAEGVVPRAKDAPEAPPPDALLELEQYAIVCVELAEQGAVPRAILEARAIEAPAWRRSALHWRRSLEREKKRGERALRDRHDDAYVGAWEAKHPDR